MSLLVERWSIIKPAGTTRSSWCIVTSGWCSGLFILLSFLIYLFGSVLFSFLFFVLFLLLFFVSFLFMVFVPLSLFVLLFVLEANLIHTWPLGTCSSAKPSISSSDVGVCCSVRLGRPRPVFSAQVVPAVKQQTSHYREFFYFLEPLGSLQDLYPN